jgi:hypothetical protein
LKIAVGRRKYSREESNTQDSLHADSIFLTGSNCRFVSENEGGKVTGIGTYRTYLADSTEAQRRNLLLLDLTRPYHVCVYTSWLY